MSKIIIEKDKEKIAGLILFFVIQNIISFFMIYFPDFFISKIARNELFIFIIGLVLFILSFLMIISHILLLINKKKGIVLTDIGIIDHSNYESLGYIKWEDITDIKSFKNYSGGYLELTIRNKKEYMKNNINFLKRILIIMNSWYPNETINLNCRRLNCTFKELENSVFLKWKNRVV